jgi:nicotinamide riboside kinase
MIFDRCALDGIVYSEWLFNSGKISRECYDACKLIYKDLQDKYDIIFYTSPDDVKLVDDGERSVDKEFRDNILELFDLYMHSYKGKIIVLKGSVEERLKTIKSALANFNIDIKI